jgi:peptidoglycan hydrolase-like protein with peptidoglycan-binding domain
MKSKIYRMGFGCLVLGLFFAGSVQGITQEEIALQNQLEEIKKQLEASLGTTSSSPTPYVPAGPLGCVNLLENVYATQSVPRKEVSILQQYLMNQGYSIGVSAPTGYFGPLTKAALAKFQINQGISPAEGWLGPITRGRIQSLTCGGGVSSATPIVLGPTSSGNVSVRIKANTDSGVVTVDKGDAVRLEWESDGATHCALGAPFNQGVSVEDTERVSSGSAYYPSSSGTKYSIICLGAEGIATDEVVVAFEGEATPTPTPTQTPTTNTSARMTGDLKVSKDGVTYTDGPISLSYGEKMWFKWSSTVSNDSCHMPTPAISGGVANSLLGSGFSNFAFGPMSPGINGYPFTAHALSIPYTLRCSGGVYDGNTALSDTVIVNFVGQNPAASNVPTTDPAPSTPTPTQTPVSTKFSQGDAVFTTSNLNVRATANGVRLNTVPLGTKGTVEGGPQQAGGLWWWNVDFGNSGSGWSAQNYLSKTEPIIGGLRIVASFGGAGAMVTGHDQPSLSIGGALFGHEKNGQGQPVTVIFDNEVKNVGFRILYQAPNESYAVGSDQLLLTSRLIEAEFFSDDGSLLGKQKLGASNMVGASTEVNLPQGYMRVSESVKSVKLHIPREYNSAVFFSSGIGE